MITFLGVVLDKRDQSGLKLLVYCPYEVACTNNFVLIEKV